MVTIPCQQNALGRGKSVTKVCIAYQCHLGAPKIALGALENNLFLCPFVTHFGLHSCDSDLGLLLLFFPLWPMLGFALVALTWVFSFCSSFPPPLCWVLCVMELVRVSLSIFTPFDSSFPPLLGALCNETC